MPWKVFGKCVHKLNDDGSKGELVKCHTSSNKASQHVKALYANVDDVAKQLMLELLDTDEEGLATIKKEDGRYKIVTVSTAALMDRQGETFTTKAMDWDIDQAKATGMYPEFRVFHSPALGFGRVDEMKRVGIFAIDSGYSYTDPFSLDICEKMLVGNEDGKWRVSRGFKAVELWTDCPLCRNTLGITQKHMVLGFRCPSCQGMHLSFKGMPNVQYMKARTFDVSVTDVPVVPMTSAAAFLEQSDLLLEDFMNKKQLKERLLEAGIEEEAVDERLKSVTDKQAKSFDDIPDATLLKELELELVEEGEWNGGDADEIDVAILVKSITDSVVAGITNQFQTGKIEVELPSFDVELKEDTPTAQAIEELAAEVVQLKEQIAGLVEMEEQRQQDWTPRKSGTTLRILKGGGKKKKMPADYDDDDEDEEETEETANGTKVKKSTARWLSNFKATVPKDPAGVIQDANGNQYDSMSEWLNS